ncbi:hypothetical protein [Phaeodactylibacter luteus]|uniref:Uncharacterized protein n=1 Tax=Phaeodactylibacter luteus TaxID=1564516 RepID=A0A5C6RLL8_9BACT|nr:hypothetical protein [Phaeodactylibacter luteus]TXB62520.1 hypothetical protein FRY97_13565 [Phaeodactylibacter luteus]
MRHYFYLRLGSTLALFALLLAAGCKKDDCAAPGQDFIPDEVLDEIRANGQVLYSGTNPPRLSGSYRISPLNLVSSNFDDFLIPGHTFEDERVTFSNFNRDDLTLLVAFEQANTMGQEYGSFISGSGDRFTIYVRIESEDTEGHTTLITKVYSGIVADDGIRDMQQSLFMVDDRGDPNNAYIENGQGRLVEDGDGFSEAF